MGLQELSDLSQFIRSEKKHRSRTHWPKDFKEAVIFEFSQGTSLKSICEATGISASTVRKWLPSRHKKGMKRRFRQVHVSPFVEGGALLLISTQKGIEVRGVSFSELRQLLKDGLL